VSDAPARAERILVVDDEEHVLRMLQKALRNEGFEILVAEDGQKGYEVAEAQEPDLVLLDLMMPRFDGYHFLKLRSQHPVLKDTPVMILTAYGSEADMVRAIQEGADDFVVKPVSLTELTARLRARLRDRRTVADLRGRRRDQELLLDLSTALASQLDSREILFLVATRLAELIGVDRACFIIVSRDHAHGYVIAASEDPEAHNIRIALENYPEIQEVVRSREPLLIPDVAEHPLLAGVKEAIARTEMRSLMLFPLLVGEEVLGVIFLRARTQRRELSSREDHICRIVANATAVALKNAQVVETIRGETQKIRMARLLAENRLRELQRYEDFCEYASHGMATVDATGAVLFVNRAGEAILGRPRAEVVGRSLSELVHPRDHAKMALVLREAHEGLPPRSMDLEVHAPDGGPRVLAVSASALLGNSGAAVLSFRDVTEERALEVDLRKTKDFLEGLVHRSVDAIVAADFSGRILLWNEAAERLLGYDSVEALGALTLDRIFPAGEVSDLLRLLHDEERGGAGRLSPVRREVIARDGTRFPVRMSGGILHDGERERAFFCILSDLRAQEELQARLTQAHERLSASPESALVAELAGTAAHELNQPLTSLLGLADKLCRELADDHPARPAADAVAREVERIAEVVRKLGRLTRYETKPYVGGAKIVDLDRSSGDGQAG
jgi:PAS domain S-box-containing protein